VRGFFVVNRISPKAGRAGQVIGAIILGVAVAVLIPGSPIYLPKIISNGDQYDGHSARYWIRALNHSDKEIRKRSIFALGVIGLGVDDAVPALMHLLSDPDREIRIETALALSKMDPASRLAVPALAQALKDEEPWVRMNAAIALMRLKKDSHPALPALLEAIDDEDNMTNLGAFHFTIQEVITLAIGRAGAGDSEAVSKLLEALSPDNPVAMRVAAARALGEMEQQDKRVVHKLQAMLKEKNDHLRQTVTESLERIGPDLVICQAPAKGLGDPDDMQLAESETAYLWDIEHHGNVLVKYGFNPLAEALKKGDGPGLFRLLSEDFTGSTLSDPQIVKTDSNFAEVVRLQNAGHPAKPLSSAGFVDLLMEFRKIFATEPPQVKLSLITLSPMKRGQLDGLWEGTAQLRLNGEHVQGAPAEVMVQLRYQAPRPTEENLAKPGWLRQASVLQVLTSKAPHYLFTEVAKKRGLDPTKLHDNWKSSAFIPTPGGVYICDFNRDGILDVLITDVTGNALYQGKADGTFEDITSQCGLPRNPQKNSAAAWIDIDGDGWEDLILGGRIFRNDHGKDFVDYTDRSNLRLPLDASSIVVADYDRDGKVDLYVTRSGRRRGNSWLDGKSGDRRGNLLFRNLGDWQFKDVTRATGTRGGYRSTFTAAWLDANNDGWPDLHVINEFGDGVLLINKGDGTFHEQALANHPADFGSMGLAVGDINNDGNIDIYCANMYSKAGSRVISNLASDAYPPPILEKMRRFVAGSQLHLNKGGLEFEQVGKKMQVASVGWSYGACLADLDNDGWLDIYATAGYVSQNRNEPDG
jgi:hypothetical protein